MSFGTNAEGPRAGDLHELRFGHSTIGTLTIPISYSQWYDREVAFTVSGHGTEEI